MPDFYYIDFSSPCRAIALTADVLNIELNRKFIDLAAKQHLTPEYAKINPHKTVPCIVDGDLVLNESRAQLCYLANQYAPTSTLYPQDAKKRALVDNALYFDATSLYSTFISLVYSILKEGALINESLFKKTEYYLELFDEDLKRTKYAASDEHMTIADISLLTTYKSIECTGFWNLEKYSAIKAWVERLKPQFKNWDKLLEVPNKQYGVFINHYLTNNKAKHATA